MNKKIVVRRQDGQVCYCILSGDKDLSTQLNEALDMRGSFGYSVHESTKRVEVVDYVSWECVCAFDVICFEDTEEDLVLQWAELETKQPE